MLGGEEEESRIGEDGSIRLSDSFEQEADPFRIIFHVEGDAKLAKDQDTLSENKWEEANPCLAGGGRTAQGRGE